MGREQDFLDNLQEWRSPTGRSDQFQALSDCWCSERKRIDPGMISIDLVLLDYRMLQSNGNATGHRASFHRKRVFVRVFEHCSPAVCPRRLEICDCFRPEKMPTMQQLCSRCFKLHFNPRLGLHTHVPILFDYFHLSALTATVHGSLLCLIPPYVFDRYARVFSSFILQWSSVGQMCVERLCSVFSSVKISHK